MKNLLLLVVTLIITLIVAEIVIGIIIPAPVVYPINITSGNGEHSLSFNKKLIYVPRPNTGEFNSKGYRGREFPFKREPGKKRLVFIGDSVTEGLGVPYKKRFTELLSNKMGDDYEIINLSVRGYNLLQEIEYFKEVGVKYKPDVVLVCITYNDLDLHAGEVSRFNIKLDTMNSVGFFNEYYANKKKIEMLLLKSNIYRYFYLFLLKMQKGNYIQKETFSEAIYYKIKEGQIDEIIDNLVEYSLQYNFKLGFIFLPTPSKSDQIELLRDMINDRGIDSLDLYEYVKKTYGDDQIVQVRYFSDQCHLNEEGNVIVADAVYNMFYDFIK